MMERRAKLRGTKHKSGRPDNKTYWAVTCKGKNTIRYEPINIGQIKNASKFCNAGFTDKEKNKFAYLNKPEKCALSV